MMKRKKEVESESFSDDNPFIHALGTNQSSVLHDTVQDLRTTESKEGFFTIRNVCFLSY